MNNHLNYILSRKAEDNPYGLSIGDLMASLLLIIILILTSVMLKLEIFLEEKSSQMKVISEQEIIKRNLISKLINDLSKYKIEIDQQTGNVVIVEGVLFEFNKFDITSEGANFLNKFVPDYINILLTDTVTRSQISQIIIEGHTDNIGSYEYNLELSLNRAKSVANYIFSERIGDFPHKKELHKLLSVSGRSFVEPRYSNDTRDGRQKNRRVEFKFRLKDWDMIYSQSQKER
jgi:chemotaxis protein MotB